MRIVNVQASELEEMNDMLTEAGDTFHQKDQEIKELQALITDYEDKVKQQVRRGGRVRREGGILYSCGLLILPRSHRVSVNISM